jgi:hypothetical protein
MNLLLLSNSTNVGQPYLDWPLDYIDRFLGDVRKCLFIPYAAVNFSYDDYEAKVQQALQVKGINVRSIHHADDPTKAIESAESILVITVYYRSIEEVDLSGACELETSGSINGESFALEVSGAAEADLTLNVTNFELELSGGGDIDLNGIANNVAIGISGAAEVNAFELESKKANIFVSGAGEVEINASEELDVDISGAGEITYIGNPTIKKNISGVGELKQK